MGSRVRAGAEGPGQGVPLVVQVSSDGQRQSEPSSLSSSHPTPEGAREHLNQVSVLCAPGLAPLSCSKPKFSPLPTRPSTTCPSTPYLPLFRLSSLPPLLQPHGLPVPPTGSVLPQDLSTGCACWLPPGISRAFSLSYNSWFQCTSSEGPSLSLANFKTSFPHLPTSTLASTNSFPSFYHVLSLAY